ncbi:DEAD/DEAH box helicase [bacterium]|nr:DEAD/DEAH box helicase [bacterium]
MNLDTLLKWKEPKLVNTQKGVRRLRTATPNSKFWGLWQTSKDKLKENGISVSKSIKTNAWQVCWWQIPGSKKERRKESKVEDASRALSSDIEIPCPDGLEFYPFQKAGIGFILDRFSKRQDVLLGDEMGIGKGIQTLGVINSLPIMDRILIIVPASLRINWKREADKWLIHPYPTNIIVGGKQIDWKPSTITIINYDVIAKHRQRIKEWGSYDLLVCDEAQNLRNPTTSRSLNILGGKKTITIGGKKKTTTYTPIKAEKKLFLTGTPILNKPVELWPVLHAIDKEDLGNNYSYFTQRYCNAHQGVFGWDVSGACNLKELQTKARSKFMIRRLKEDVLTELPPKRKQVIELPIGGAAQQVQAEIQKWDTQHEYIHDLELRSKRANKTEQKKIKKNILSAKKVLFEEMSKLRHDTAIAKVPAVIDHLKNVLESGPVVCFAHHKDVIEQLQLAFKKICVVITGSTNLIKRQQAVDDFQAGKKELFIGNIQAAGVGITLTKSCLGVFAEMDWVPGIMEQADGRLHRLTQTQSVLIQYLVLEDSLDARMVRKLIEKTDIIHQALDKKS